ncbi:flavin-containing monooxygenase [Tsukamurella ocularis]|uniref:flavin-containing monooxygenase n=1 Tax=Tsukamurella ocularis TaxID=1970234 RepID=UPI00216A0190|nr:NAD(P)/FAD-dependent oxidoreductase [Tsukamurella ocularis]MCS3778807.1 cation diffusion facilitator CzcD-associated flavoprotein CzcO [Tsukamurella ocularis]MCS3787573.1 cation diffusion facilitator CzcD-associated flavoprotein CzcO [Tsukamurella ocularis]MCS3851490.1 cation diffusion facilitator CzcD-associated flavoprotein CzcO [Tsukamurella ocularis]
MARKAKVVREASGAKTQPDHLVAIIGAGFGGLGVGIGLKRAGIGDFVILERAPGVGGTWLANSYPDVAVDVPGIVYQFSFEKNPDWSRTFPKGAEVRQYIERLVGKYGLEAHLRFDSDVTSREWDEEKQWWRLRLATGDEVTAKYVVTALGAFVEPRLPDIEGLDKFQGKVIQTQVWDHDYDFAGKRAAVIGTGATSVQLVPQLARMAAHLDVYQRRAIWVFAKPDFAIPRMVRTAFRVLPVLQSVVRGLVAGAVEVGLVGVTVYGKQIAPLTLIPAWACRAFLFTQVRDGELRKKLTPGYGFGCKRPSVSNLYYKTYTRPDVDLVTDPIARVTETGIETRDGVHRDIDVLVLATGFEMSQSPDPYRRRPVRGRDGFDLADFYEHNRARAYEGVCMPQLPNHFMVFGPFAWSGSSWHVMVENAIRIITRVIGEAERRGATSVAVSTEATDRFFDFISERGKATLMHGKSCVDANSYYIDKHGDFGFLRPTTAYQSTRASKNFPLSDFEFAAAPGNPGAPLPVPAGVLSADLNQEARS